MTVFAGVRARTLLLGTVASLALSACGGSGDDTGDPPVVTPPTVNTVPVLDIAATATVDEGDSFNVPFTATDADGDAVTVTILPDEDAAFFAVDLDANILFAPAGPFDFENAQDADGDNVYSIVVQASDGTDVTTQAVDITVANVREAPSCAAGQASVLRNATGRLGDIDVTVRDEGESLQSLQFSANAEPQGLTGLLEFAALPDSASPGTYNVSIAASEPLDLREPTARVGVTATFAGGPDGMVTADCGDFTLSIARAIATTSSGALLLGGFGDIGFVASATLVDTTAVLTGFSDEDYAEALVVDMASVRSAVADTGAETLDLSDAQTAPPSRRLVYSQTREADLMFIGTLELDGDTVPDLLFNVLSERGDQAKAVIVFGRAARDFDAGPLDLGKLAPGEGFTIEIGTLDTNGRGDVMLANVFGSNRPELFVNLGGTAGSSEESRMFIVDGDALSAGVQTTELAIDASTVALALGPDETRRGARDIVAISDRTGDGYDEVFFLAKELGSYIIPGDAFEAARALYSPRGTLEESEDDAVGFSTLSPTVTIDTLAFDISRNQGDFTGDGTQDLLLGTSGGLAGKVVTEFDFAGNDPIVVDIDGSSFSLRQTRALADVDGDGTDELLIDRAATDRLGTSGLSVERGALIRDESAARAAGREPPNPPEGAIDSVSIRYNPSGDPDNRDFNLKGYPFGDLDGDGRGDLALVDRSLGFTFILLGADINAAFEADGELDVLDLIGPETQANAEAAAP